MENCLDCRILRATTMTFINQEGLVDKFVRYAIDMLLDECHLSVEEVSEFLARMKEDQK